MSNQQKTNKQSVLVRLDPKHPDVIEEVSQFYRTMELEGDTFAVVDKENDLEIFNRVVESIKDKLRPYQNRGDYYDGR